MKSKSSRFEKLIKKGLSDVKEINKLMFSITLNRSQVTPANFKPPEKKANGDVLEITELNPSESKRTYHYSDGTKLQLCDVTHFLNSNSTHRLKTKDGKLWIVEKKFIAIEIDVSEFTL